MESQVRLSLRYAATTAGARHLTLRSFVMTLERVTCVGVCILMTSVGASAQQRSESTGPEPGTSVTERAYAAKDIRPWRLVQIRTDADGRQKVVETLERPNIDGRMAPIEETVTDTRRSSSTTTQISREVYGFAGVGRALLQTTDSQQDRQPNGDTVTVHTT